MAQPQWPRLCLTNPADIKEHAASLSSDLKAVQEFLRAGFSNAAPSLPRGLKSKIRKGIGKCLVSDESRDYSTTSISAEDRDLICSAILEEITAKTAAAFHTRVPQYLFKILQESYDELHVKIVAQYNAAPQEGPNTAGMALRNEVQPQTPPDSPPEETDSEMSVDYGSDTEALAHHDLYKTTKSLTRRARKFKAQLQEVEHQRKTLSQGISRQASQITKKIRDVELEEKAANERYTKAMRAMAETRLEQDRTGDYGTEYVGYKVTGSADDCFAKLGDAARRVFLAIESQAVVNRLFNMPAKVLMRKVKEAVEQRSKSVGEELFLSIEYCLGAELLDNGNVALWGNKSDEDDVRRSERIVSDARPEVPFWDQDILASFASHITEPYETYPVEVRDITVEKMSLQNRKRKAEAITKLVQQNVTAIPFLHIDLIRDIRFSRRTTNDNSLALVLGFSNPVTANEVIDHGLQWQGAFYSCEVFDNKFLDRCGRCQAYGHHTDACSGPLRCARCALHHRAKQCTSFFLRCALCEAPHCCGSSGCSARSDRINDKRNARFPIGKDSSILPVPSTKPTAPSPSSSSPETHLSNPQQEHVGTTKEQHSDPGSAPAHTKPPERPTLSARQLQDTLPATEAASWPNVSGKRKGSVLTPHKDLGSAGHDERVTKKTRLC